MTILLEWDADAFDLQDFEVKAGASIDTGVYRTAPGAMKTTNPGPGEQRDQGYQHVNGMAFQINFGGHYFYHFWMKMAANVSYYYAEKWKVGRWNVVDESVPGVLTTNIRKTGFQVAEHPSGFTSDQGEGSGDDGPEIAYDFNPATNSDVQNWQEYVAELKVHSAADATDGWCKFYVYDEAGNGGEVSSPGLTGVRWWSGTLSQVWDVKGCFMMWNYPQEISGDIWIDDCRVATTLAEARGQPDTPGWKANAYTNLTIPDGNILDFSSLIPAGPAGQYGRVIINSDGHLAFTNQPATPVRFLCAGNPFGPPSYTMTTHTNVTINAMAHQLRVHGYNLVRLHLIQNTYMKNATADFDFDPDEVERVHYMLAALKAEGIYWTVDIVSDNEGGYLNPSQHNLKLGLYYDTAEQNHWKACADNFWNVVNPYTGITTLADPALAFVVSLNEGILNVLLEGEPSAPAGLEDKFVDWLIAKYTNTATMCAAWGDCTDDNLETRNVNMPINSAVANARQADMQHFFADLEGSTYTWMKAYLQSIGYTGLTTSLDQNFVSEIVYARSAPEIVDLHAYHDYGGSQPGDTRSQNPLTNNSAIYPRHLAAQKYLGKPFTVTEHGALFWNKWRHQNGLMIGAYAALQGFDMLAEHAGVGSIELSYLEHLRYEQIRTFGVGMDPVRRVGQTLEVLLFLRGDVTTSPSKVRADLSAGYVFDPSRAGLAGMQSDVTNIGLVTGMGYYLSGSPPASDLIITVGDLDADPTPWATRITQLRTEGLISAGNLTHDTNAIYQSDTEEILLEITPIQMRVVTPKTEAAFFNTTFPLALTQLYIVSSTVPAMVSVSSMDGQTIANSGSLLLMIATDAQNTDMTFEEPGQNTLVTLGTLPIMLKTVEIVIRLYHSLPWGFHLYALSLNGTRNQELTVTQSGSYIEFTINTDTLAGGPTTFFELEQDFVESPLRGPGPGISILPN